MPAAPLTAQDIAPAQRPPRWPALLFALAFTLAVNLGLLALVAALTRMHRVAELEPEAAVRFTAATAPPPPPPPPAPAPVPAPTPEAMLPALPPLEPAMPSAAAVALPAPGLAAMSLDTLPLSIPSFVPAAPSTGIADGSGGPALTIDRAAHIESPPEIARFYPFAARSHGITGESIIVLHIGADGRIGSFDIESSAPTGVFESSLAPLVASLRADPATAQGRPVASSLRVRIQWTLPR